MYILNTVGTTTGCTVDAMADKTDPGMRWIGVFLLPMNVFVIVLLL